MISLRKETEYAIQFIQYLSKNKNKCCSLKIFAEKSKISFYFMQKIARKLSQNNIIMASHGVSGGYALKAPNYKINLLKIVQVMENGVKLLPCVNSINNCNRALKRCPVRTMMCKINKKFITAMNKIDIF
ncbi:MAG: hypothetical protein COU31_00690 [Candidatus Magasanikbacteria bacterium CG10_big_fil_rev_8_21_14_0_10_40_10]|uniref:Rrf2 family transcriptional regulator n=1 Tax=Candidatus Magasanikbacteria bacterium CG10_big_fil_rev_8_21_14_0_10_40_10 TaxID=1974648 RepID=A0A2M6W4W2_9BACT|nr:MAG: hypothetical protein COU31_00690 [Candidatus Magasanikbacteria bacterium CG10_big_fil_rev_8_21_14_0_10_40_10]